MSTSAAIRCCAACALVMLAACGETLDVHLSAQEMKESMTDGCNDMVMVTPGLTKEHCECAGAKIAAAHPEGMNIKGVWEMAKIASGNDEIGREFQGYVGACMKAAPANATSADKK